MIPVVIFGISTLYSAILIPFLIRMIRSKEHTAALGAVFIVSGQITIAILSFFLK